MGREANTGATSDHSSQRRERALVDIAKLRKLKKETFFPSFLPLSLVPFSLLSSLLCPTHHSLRAKTLSTNSAKAAQLKFQKNRASEEVEYAHFRDLPTRCRRTFLHLELLL